MSANKKEVLSFNKTIPPNTPLVFEEDINSPATVERIRVKFYQSQAKKLQIIVDIVKNGGTPQPLITFVKDTDAFLSGDDEELDMAITIPVDTYDKVRVRVTNTDLSETYTCSVFVTVDYYGGKTRVV